MLQKPKKQRENYALFLYNQELSIRTIKKYSHDLDKFLNFIGKTDSFVKSDIISYKNFLISRYKTNTVNSYLLSVNKFFNWLGLNNLAAKSLKIQKKYLNNIINIDEYQKMLDTCKKKLVSQLCTDKNACQYWHTC